MWIKLKKLFKWMWQQLKDPINLVIYICVLIVFFSPAGVGYAMAIITKNAWHTSYATAYLLFWAGPFTPAIPLQITIALGIRKLLKVIKNKRSKHKMRKEFKAIDYRIQRSNQLNEVFINQDPATIQNGVPHEYRVARYDEKSKPIFETDVVFQKGPRTEATSTPGVIESDLLEIVRNRLQAHQASEYATRENALALTAIEEALMWMQKRADDRAERGVLGTTEK